MRAYANNSAGTAYGSQISFTTSAQIQLPTLTTTAASSVSTTSAISGGSITSDGGETITARGVCWSTSQNPTTSNSKTTDGTGTGSFSSSITGLNPNTTYHLRAYAINSVGTAYGSDIAFTTKSTISTNTDPDGNTYTTVTIGTQVWMTENLRTTKYNDNTAIPLVTDNTSWGKLTTPGYSWYNNDPTTKIAFYNGYTIDTRKLCPTGWHVPSDAEWTILTDYLGGESVAAGKLKEIGTSHWNSPNTGATNSSGFTALPVGGRSFNGNYDTMGLLALWWSSTATSTTTAWYRFIMVNDNKVTRFNPCKCYGYSVRCLKD